MIRVGYTHASIVGVLRPDVAYPGRNVKAGKEYNDPIRAEPCDCADEHVEVFVRPAGAEAGEAIITCLDPLPDEARCPNCGLEFYCYRLDTANEVVKAARAHLDALERHNSKYAPGPPPWPIPQGTVADTSRRLADALGKLEVNDADV